MSDCCKPCCPVCKTTPCCCNIQPLLPSVAVPLTTCPTQNGADPGVSSQYEDIDCFNLPAVDQGINVTVADADQWLLGLCVVVRDGIEEAIMRIDNVNTTTNQLFLVNIGADGNPEPGYSFQCPAQIMMIGPCPDVTGSATDCFQLHLHVFEPFTAPALLSSVQVKLVECADLHVGQALYIQGMGIVRILTIDGNDPRAIITVEPICYLSSITPGVSTIPAGSYVTEAEICVTHSDEFTGSGGPDSPLTLATKPAFNVFNPTSPIDANFLCTNAAPIAVPPNPPVALGDIIPWTNVEFDALGDFNLGSNRFECSVAGTYHFIAGISVHETFGMGEYSLALLKNGNDILNGCDNDIVFSSSDSTDQGLVTAVLAQLAEGDYIQVIIIENSGPNTIQIEPGMFAGYLVQK